ncbi:hypothetical protein KAW08_01970 [bacterium]|nr:hypothetical protein [bacterium]
MNEICLSNERLEVRLNKKLMSLKVIDKQSSFEWNCQELFHIEYAEGIHLTHRHCKADFEKVEDRIKIKLHSFRYWARWPEHYYCRPEKGPNLLITLEILLKKDCLRFIIHPIKNMDEEQVAISFPYNLGKFSAKEQGQFVLPYKAGLLLSFPREDTILQDDWIYGSLTMPIFGVLRNKNGLACIIETPFDCRVKTSANQLPDENVGISPIFVFENKRLNYERMLDYFFVSNATYVDIAKVYRKRLIEKGRFVSLKQKIEENPEVEKLVGAVVWKHNVFCNERPEGVKKDYSLYVRDSKQAVMEGKPANWTAKELFATAKERGFDRLVVYNTGWNCGGFDSMYPTKFQPNPLRGTEEDFKRIASWARSLNDGYIFSIHDNYSEAYKNSSEWNSGYIIKNRGGGAVGIGIWRGGRSYSICPSDAVKFAKRNIPRIAAMLGRGSIYIDVLGCVALKECFDKKHPMTKEQDAQRRYDIFTMAKKHLGSVASESSPLDFLCGIIDIGAFFPIHANFNLFTDLQRPIPIPLFQLVYHDSVLNYTSESYTKFYGDEYLLYVALYNLLPFSLEDISLRLSRELRETYKAEMTSHKFITEPKITFSKDGCFWTEGVQETNFSDGTTVIANFNKEPYSFNGKLIKGRDFIIIRDREEL